ncbi:MAG: hypothetical protein SWH68_09975 [Thermodesulfobacteriota bacterium]|nr:hypothetical protein [Thermodesulfobacteriota bacterium]
MKQKYIIEKDDNKTDLVIREFSELEKAEYSLLIEQTYKLADIKKAAAEGTEALMTAIRTSDFFPPHSITEKIAVAVTALLSDSGQDSIEVAVDDAKILKEEEAGLEEELEPEEDIDELLEDDFSFDAGEEEADKDEGEEDAE